MRALRITSASLMCAAVVGLGAGVAAAQTPSRPRDAQPEPEFFRRSGSPVLRIWQDFTLGSGDAVRGVLVVSGSATIEGRVDGDVVVVFGPARLASTAVVEGSLIVIAGSATLADGADVHRDLVVIGGALDAPPRFSPGGEYIVIGATTLGDRLRAVVPWVTRGLLWGRLIVPDLPWVWGVVAIFLIVSLALNLLLHEPVGACAETLTEKPFSTFLVGLLVLLLTGPVSLVLAASLIGLAVVPFLICALLVAWIVGKVGVARWIGRSVTGQASPESRLQAMRSLVIGFAAIYLLYMVPVLGVITWAMVGVFGLGAASLAFVAALRRERPAPIVPVAAAPVPSAPPVPPLYVGAAVPPPSAHDYATPTPPDSPAATPGAVELDLTLLPRATFLDRVAAFTLDVALVLIATGLLDLTRRDGATLIVLFAYFIAFWTWKGTTIGGIICNLRVIRTDGVPLRFADALVRGLSSLFSFAVLLIGCLWILRDPERQAWHDKIAGTYVVKVPRGWPLP